MPITEVTVPETRHFRESVFSREDADQAYELLKAGKAAQYERIEDDGSTTKGGANKAESMARSRGITLNKQITTLYGERYAVSVWKDAEGFVIGALLPQPPRQATNPNGRKGGKSK